MILVVVVVGLCLTCAGAVTRGLDVRRVNSYTCTHHMDKREAVSCCSVSMSVLHVLV